MMAAVASEMRQTYGVLPATVTVYETTLAQAEAASSRDIVPGDNPVYLFVFTGHFRMLDDVWSPAPLSNAPPPEGTVVTFIVSKATGEGLGDGISNWPVLTAGLGQPQIIAAG